MSPESWSLQQCPWPLPVRSDPTLAGGVRHSQLVASMYKSCADWHKGLVEFENKRLEAK